MKTEIETRWQKFTLDHNRLVEKIKTSWQKFRRDCMRVSLIRHHGFAPDKITDEVLDDVEKLIKLSNECPISSSELIGLLKMDFCPCQIIKACNWIIKEGCLLNPIFIIWVIRDMKIKCPDGRGQNFESVD